MVERETHASWLTRLVINLHRLEDKSQQTIQGSCLLTKALFRTIVPDWSFDNFIRNDRSRNLLSEIIILGSNID